MLHYPYNGRCEQAVAKRRRETHIASAAAKVYKLLWDGEYFRKDGKRERVHGDTAKIPDAIGLTAAQRALLQNYRFMSSRLPGTRQVFQHRLGRPATRPLWRELSSVLLERTTCVSRLALNT